MKGFTILHPLEWPSKAMGREMFVKYEILANGDVYNRGIVDVDGKPLAFFTPPTGNKQQGILSFFKEEKKV